VISFSESLALPRYFSLIRTAEPIPEGSRRTYANASAVFHPSPFRSRADQGARAPNRVLCDFNKTDLHDRFELSYHLARDCCFSQDRDARTLEAERERERERERAGGEERTLCAVNRGRSAILSESQTSVRRDPRSSSADISFSPARILPSFLPPPPLTPLLLLLLIESGRILVNFREEVLYKCRRIIQRPVSIHSAP